MYFKGVFFSTNLFIRLQLHPQLGPAIGLGALQPLLAVGQPSLLALTQSLPLQFLLVLDPVLLVLVLAGRFLQVQDLFEELKLEFSQVFFKRKVSTRYL